MCPLLGKIRKSEMVDDLKDMIKKNKEHTLAGFNADRLDIWPHRLLSPLSLRRSFAPLDAPSLKLLFTGTCTLVTLPSKF